MMQAFSDPTLNFLFVLVFVIVLVVCCAKACNRNAQGGGLGGTSGLSMSSRMLSGCGTVFLVLGMTFYYAFGPYAIGLWAPLAIIAMILIVAGSCKAKADQDYIPPATRQSAFTPTAQHYQPEPAAMETPDVETIVRTANLASERGFLDERQDPNDPSIMIPGIRCPSCGVRSDLESTRIVNNVVHCPNCRYRITL